MAYQAFRDEYFQTPPVTRVYTTACVLTTLGVVSVVPLISISLTIRALFIFVIVILGNKMVSFN